MPKILRPEERPKRVRIKMILTVHDKFSKEFIRNRVRIFKDLKKYLRKSHVEIQDFDIKIFDKK